MKKTRLIAPYYQDKYKMRHSASLPNRYLSGVYMIYKNGNLVYVGFSRFSVYKALYRHFQQWNDKRQIRVTYNPTEVKVRVIYCTPQQADKLEKALILKYKPKDNPQQYDLYEADKSEIKVLEKFENDTPLIYNSDLETPF